MYFVKFCKPQKGFFTDEKMVAIYQFADGELPVWEVEYNDLPGQGLILRYLCLLVKPNSIFRRFIWPTFRQLWLGNSI